VDINRYTQKSREAVAAAQQLAAERHHQEVTGKHLLLALLSQEGGLVPRFLEHAGVNTGIFAGKADELLRKIPAVTGYEGSLRLGAGDYVKKPYLLRTLGQAVQKELKRPPLSA